MNEIIEQAISRGKEIEIVFLWTCASVLFTERGIPVGLKNNSLSLKVTDGKVVEMNIDNILDVGKTNP